eukprot:2452047-Heterocapsa_arctica.AAC.1
MASVLRRVSPPLRPSTIDLVVASYCRGSAHAWSERQARRTCLRILRLDGKPAFTLDDALTATIISSLPAR